MAYSASTGEPCQAVSSPSCAESWSGAGPSQGKRHQPSEPSGPLVSKGAPKKSATERGGPPSSLGGSFRSLKNSWNLAMSGRAPGAGALKPDLTRSLQLT
eukprot:15281222-Alexandrium_andersonii.AAC.1